MVRLDQLGRQYRTEIRTLDRIPDSELDRLAGWGFNALWLIGIWERSAASKRIKQLRGDQDARLAQGWRAELLGGRATIDSSPGAGTRVDVRIPLPLEVT